MYLNTGCLYLYNTLWVSTKVYYVSMSGGGSRCFLNQITFQWLSSFIDQRPHKVLFSVLRWSERGLDSPSAARPHLQFVLDRHFCVFLYWIKDIVHHWPPCLAVSVQPFGFDWWSTPLRAMKSAEVYPSLKEWAFHSSLLSAGELQSSQAVSPCRSTKPNNILYFWH